MKYFFGKFVPQNLEIRGNILSFPLWFPVGSFPFRTPLGDHYVNPGEACHQNFRFSSPVSLLCLPKRAETRASQAPARPDCEPSPWP